MARVQTKIPTLREQSLTDGPLKILYVPVGLALEKRWDRNFRVHDIPGTKRSIRKHGFRNPAIFDDVLNDGAGGISAGNGRTQALVEMRDAAEDLPQYLREAAGEWYFPMIFGVASATLAMAEASAIDDNNTALGVIPAEEAKKIWQPEGYLTVLRDLEAQNQLPTTVSPEQLSKWLAAATPPEPQEVSPEVVAEALKKARPAIARIAVYGADIALIEQALAATGKQHDRAAALGEICQHFLSVHG